VTIRTPVGAPGALGADWLTVTDLPATVIVALRALPVFCAMVYETLALPVRAPPPIVIHDGTAVTDHPHDAPIVTAIVPVRDDEVAEIVRGVTVDEQEVPGWITLNVRPAIVALLLRCAVPVFAAMATETLPGPVRFEPLFTAIHDPLPDADQPQPLPVETATLMVSPAATDVREAGEIE
jgi:hypothetical protein